MNKYFLKLGNWRGESMDPLHFGWFIVESFVLNFTGRGPVSSSPHLRPSDLPDLPLTSAEYVIRISSGQELAEKLAIFKREGKFPIVISGSAFEWLGMKSEACKTCGDFYVTITDYNERTREVTIRNEWSRDQTTAIVRTSPGR